MMIRIVLASAFAGAAACQPADPVVPPEESSDVRRPLDHSFFRAKEIETALILGDLEAAHASARWMLDSVEPNAIHLRWRAGASTMLFSAQGVAEATDMREATRHAAELASACGACHAAEHVELQPPFMPDVPARGDAVAYMQRHVWAVDRLWDGLLVPSETAWASGARALAIAPLHADLLGAPEPAAEVVDLADRVHGIGLGARTQTDPTARTRQFAELLMTCAECHTLVGADVTAASVSARR